MASGAFYSGDLGSLKSDLDTLLTTETLSESARQFIDALRARVVPPKFDTDIAYVRR